MYPLRVALVCEVTETAFVVATGAEALAEEGVVPSNIISAIVIQIVVFFIAQFYHISI